MEYIIAGSYYSVHEDYISGLYGDISCWIIFDIRANQWLKSDGKIYEAESKDEAIKRYEELEKQAFNEDFEKSVLK